MKIKRVITALIVFPIVALALIFGNKYIIDIIVMGTALIGMNEYIKCVSKKVKVISWISYLSVLYIAFVHVIPLTVSQMLLPFIIPILL